MKTPVSGLHYSQVASIKKLAIPIAECRLRIAECKAKTTATRIAQSLFNWVAMAMMMPSDIGEFGTEGGKAFYKFLEAVAKPDAHYLFVGH